MGNLYSVQRACAHVGLNGFLTSEPGEVAGADGVILPGVGGMPEAMRILDQTGLSDAIREAVAAGTPLMGVCLGLQLLMSHGSEFTPHRGLGIIEGEVVRFEGNDSRGNPLKVPHIGWTGIDSPNGEGWKTSALGGVPAGSLMYFVHSYYARPADRSIVAATARYESVEFCAAVSRDNVFACQFHPERSGPVGLLLYRNFSAALTSRLSNVSVPISPV
jgi:glutamine amidotransferase